MSVTRPSFITGVRPSRLAGVLLTLCGLLFALPTLARAAPGAPTGATKLVRYAGWSARVPTTWPVFDLAADPHTCVRFNRHAVYLGRPGDAQRCPAHAVGRTEAILVSPRATVTGADSLSATPARPTVLGGGAVASVTRAAARVVVTATWGHDPAVIENALGIRSASADATTAAPVTTTTSPTTTPPTTAVPSPTTTTTTTTTITPTTPTTPTTTAFPPATTSSSPGGVYTGLGFDACSAPSLNTMSAWSRSPFRAIGVYIGGPEMACAQSNLTASWVSTEAAAGWHLIPIYVGLQAPGNGCGCAEISSANAGAEGTAAAQSAVAESQAIGLGTGNPIYDDMENYTRTAAASEAVLTYLEAWTTELHAEGYTSGVYSSELSGIEDLVAEQGTGYDEPDDVWIANWDGAESTVDAKVPATDWALNQRLHQYRGGHSDVYGGASLDIDSDYVDAATAAPGNAALTTTIAAAPSVTVHPEDGDGTVELSPTWGGATGVTQWRFLAGASPTALTTVLAVPASRHSAATHDNDAYFQVQAVGAAGQVLGSSGVTAAPPHVAIFGHSAFVGTRGPGGLPVECFGITGCRISSTVRRGRTVLAHSGDANVAAGGGIDHFPLTPAAHRRIAAAGDAGMTVTVSVRTSTGRSAARVIRLIPYTTSGAAPRRGPLAGSGTAMRIVGSTDFVSHGWSGGVLVACPQSLPCTGAPSVTVAGHPVAVSHLQTLGAETVGYLSFRMTNAGHALLRRARGNQLGATVTVSSPTEGLAIGGTARALVSLDAF